MSSQQRPPQILVIVGPTASGKSALAIKLARKFNGEIVSADSRQIYRGMDIGTAKPNVKELTAVPHHPINIKNPNEDYTVAEYKRDAMGAIRNILHRKKLPILVGGSGLYIRAVIDNLDMPKTAADNGLRGKLEKELEEKGLLRLFQKLIELDPEAAYIVDYKNPRRVVRALEVAIKTGKPFSAQRRKGEPLFDALVIGLNPPKEELRRKINTRVEKMLRAGLVDEVKELVKKYGADCRAFDAIGYREIIGYLNRKTTIAEAAELIKKNTAAYAKRQMTWFKKYGAVKWITGFSGANKGISVFLGKNTRKNPAIN